MFRPLSAITKTVAATILVLSAVPAQAHARLAKSDPAADATISSPKMIHLEFTEGLAKKLSSLKVTAADGGEVNVKMQAASSDKVLEATPAAALAAGVYTFTWTAVANDDGHKTSGTFHFTVK